MIDFNETYLTALTGKIDDISNVIPEIQHYKYTITSGSNAVHYLPTIPDDKETDFLTEAKFVKISNINVVYNSDGDSNNGVESTLKIKYVDELTADVAEIEDNTVEIRNEVIDTTYIAESSLISSNTFKFNFAKDSEFKTKVSIDNNEKVIFLVTFVVFDLQQTDVTTTIEAVTLDGNNINGGNVKNIKNISGAEQTLKNIVFTYNGSNVTENLSLSDLNVPSTGNISNITATDGVTVALTKPTDTNINLDGTVKVPVDAITDVLAMFK
jgi:hypothetical protein